MSQLQAGTPAHLHSCFSGSASEGHCNTDLAGGGGGVQNCYAERRKEMRPPAGVRKQRAGRSRQQHLRPVRRTWAPELAASAHCQPSQFGWRNCRFD